MTDYTRPHRGNVTMTFPTAFLEARKVGYETFVWGEGLYHSRRADETIGKWHARLKSRRALQAQEANDADNG